MKSKNQIVIILDNIRSALNVGAIIRTADAINAEAIYACGITADKTHPKVKKTALGAEETMSISYRKETKRLIKQLRNKGYQIIGLEVNKKAINHWDAIYNFPAALIVGNEVSGISDEILRECDIIIKIPMLGKKESLNVATATGIASYEILKNFIGEEEK